MEHTSCLFCTLAHSQQAIVWQDKLFFAVFDAHPVSPGHTLVIPKRHVVDLVDLSVAEWTNLHNAIKNVILVIEKTNFKNVYEKRLNKCPSNIEYWFLTKMLNHPKICSKPNAYNHGINDGKAAGRTVDHLHWQIIPRFNSDVDDPRGGVRFVIPELGNYKTIREY